MIEEVLPNIYRIEVPLPGNPLKSVNSYLLVSPERNLVIDTAFNQPECLEVLKQAYDELKLDLDRTDFFATHLHADHQGLIATFAQPGAKTYMGKPDALRVEDQSGWKKMLNAAAMSGFSQEMLQTAIDNHPGHKHGPEHDMKWDHVVEGDTITVGDYTLTCLETPGHTWGHICLYEAGKKILFSGDHILGDITPNIQVWSLDDDPLQSYMTSLDKIASLEIALTLPGHRTMIPDCRKRVAELKEHHRNRCNEVIDILKNGSCHAVQTASQMTWDIRAASWDAFPLMQQWFATGEALAHLRFLENKGFVSQQPAADGVLLYALKADQEGMLTSMN
ncbi:MAG: MBL fold metallo-hydrolase [Proteobacteria bacterium]|nr:MBL fold metallo-hydrolase [Pseudomonadota bacterium]MBU1386285.1 MBL fold metallo-hydrolase [Pseudomonadota bacterium]MBU1542977.1 MBL fold metallo-hydrolase [Pseudomonadota bacterium]MBU2480000.1 MBL fold metallo-hydrolase [Pseudomonadota bacterium]